MPANYHDGDEDNRPLLADSELSSPVDSEAPSFEDSLPLPPRKKTGRHNPTVFIALCVLMVFAFDFGAYLNIAPQTRIFEGIVCRNYYDKHEPGRFAPGEIPEDQCKIKPVQAEVAFVQGLMSSFEAIPSRLSFFLIGTIHTATCLIYVLTIDRHHSLNTLWPPG